MTDDPTDNSEVPMLKLVKGGAPDVRPTRRRTAVRRTPAPEPDPIEEVLAHLDEIPDDPPPVEEPSRTVRRRTATRRPAARKQPPAPAPSRQRSSSLSSLSPSSSSSSPSPRKPEPDAKRTPKPERRRARPRRRLRLSWVTLALVVVAVATVAAAAVLGWRWNDDRTLNQAHERALAAAKQTTVNFVSVSASTVDRDLQRIVDGATGDFRDEFTRSESQVRSAVVENKVDSHGTVLRAALVSGNRHAAVVLVAIDATVKNVKTPNGRASHYRIQVDVSRDPDSGRWLVSRLQFVG
jgi:Mce-associated membrane protein